MTTYTKAEPGDEVLDLLAEAMREWHPKLAEAGVRVGVLFAENPGGVEVSHGGYPAIATVKVVSLKDRCSKHYDAELVVSNRWWYDARREHREAMLDHHLSYLRLVPLAPAERAAARARRSDAPWWKLDDRGRPKLKTVKGDWNAGPGFKAVVFRHGDFAVEFQNIASATAMAEAAKRGEVDE